MDTGRKAFEAPISMTPPPAPPSLPPSLPSRYFFCHAVVFCIFLACASRYVLDSLHFFRELGGGLHSPRPPHQPIYLHIAEIYPALSQKCAHSQIMHARVYHTRTVQHQCVQYCGVVNAVRVLGDTDRIPSLYLEQGHASLHVAKFGYPGMSDEPIHGHKSSLAHVATQR